MGKKKGVIGKTSGQWRGLGVRKAISKTIPLSTSVKAYLNRSIFTTTLRQLKKEKDKSGQTAPWLRALDALVEDLGSISSTHAAAHSHVHPSLSSRLHRHCRYMVCTHTSRRTHTYTIKIILFLQK